MTADTASGLDRAGDATAGDLSCYTASLAGYLDGRVASPLSRIARSVRLAVRTDLPGSLLAFSHHAVPLCRLDDGRHLRYQARADQTELLAELDRDLSVEGAALLVTYTGAMAWSLAGEDQCAPHLVQLTGRDAHRWRVSDAFRALLPHGRQEPYDGWLSTAELIAAMTPPPELAPEHRLRLQHAFGIALPLQPGDQFQWLRPMAPAGQPPLPEPPAWIVETTAALRYLCDRFAALGEEPGMARFVDDVWAAAQHHTFSYRHVARHLPLTPAELDAVRAAHDAWADLPMALRFAVESARRNRPRPALVRATFDQLSRAEQRCATLLRRHRRISDTATSAIPAGAVKSPSRKDAIMTVPTNAAPPSLWFSGLSSETDPALPDRAIVSGHGCVVRDAAGNEYLDARSALWNAALGYGNQRIIAAMTRQLSELPVGQIIRHDQPTRIALEYADRLVGVLPRHLSHVRFCTTGAQAVEAAVLLSRFLRRRTGEADRTEVITLWNGYHGIGGLATSLTGEGPLHEQLAPLAPGVHHVRAGDLGDLHAAIARLGADRVTALLLEPVLGTDVEELSADYLHQVQRLCRSAGIHLIVDEVSTGFGRTGCLTVTGRLGLTPDMLVLSKGITSGYAPLAAVAVTSEILHAAIAHPDELFPHGSTSDGHPLAMAAAVAVLDELGDGRVLDNVSARGVQLTAALKALGHPGIASVHGPGLMLAVALVDPAGEALTGSVMAEVKRHCRDRGLLVSISNHMVVLTPPLVITEAEVDLLVSRFEQALAIAWPPSTRPAPSTATPPSPAQPPSVSTTARSLAPSSVA
ncbi:MAG TPA: aminotransferase class III-fold pyridoxal phosphate-dependent enzyme [Micromonosporaceae bacterium]